MPPSVIYLFSFLHKGTAFMVIVQFRGCLVRPCRACVVDSLGLGITSYVTVQCVQGIPILFLLIFMPSLYSHSNLNIYLSLLINPRRACAARVTVLGLCVCYHVFAHHALQCAHQDIPSALAGHGKGFKFGVFCKNASFTIFAYSIKAAIFYHF